MTRPVPPSAEEDLQRHQAGAFSFRRSGLFLTAFSILVFLFLLFNFLRMGWHDPLESHELQALKIQIDRDRANPALKNAYRELDQRLRTEYFRNFSFAEKAAWGLTLGASALLFALFLRRRFDPIPPSPVREGNKEQAMLREAAQARWGVAGMGLILVLSLAALLLIAWAPPPSLDPAISTQSKNLGENPSPSPGPSPVQGPVQSPNLSPSTASPAIPAPSPALDPSGQWPNFRGPDGLGLAPSPDIPLQWDLKAKTHLLWKVKVPLWGANSPIVWGERIFLTGADGENKKREVYAFEAASGKLLWTRPVAAGGTGEAFEVNKETGYAAATAATDGQRVFAIFANGDLAAFDFAGLPLWAKKVGDPKNSYGHSNSLLTYRHLLIVLWDMDEGGYIAALEGATGQPVWKTDRSAGAWASLALARTPAGDQILTNGKPDVAAYDPLAGRLIWSAEGMKGDVAPSPAYGNGLVFACNTGSVLMAIKPDGKGDVTKTHLVWMADESLPDTVSPLTDGQKVWTLASDGALTCYQAADGKKLYEKALEEEYYSSPSLVAGQRVLLLSKGGTARWFSATENTYRELGKIEMGDEFFASPAFQGGRIFIRGKEWLYGLGKTP